MEWVYLKVFLFGLSIDIFYVLWFNAVNSNRKLLAGIASVLLASPALFGYLEVHANIWVSIPYLFGLFVGTILGMYLSERFKKE